MDIRERREKENIIKWLNTEVNDDIIIFDCVLDIFDEIVNELKNNNLNLRHDENTLLINLVYFLYFNSYTNIIY